ncbi:hypothetical protein AVEN_45109-1 [Araneus ventricosus]|uniref:WDR36/Utp21 C-terminal domain-containing protein n=1 Tax=Araneus ventricosus TaxID=182803 RepID=A0A4Y2S200_ARAVE|nr:hypothetical protein AVEN_45109-1 [Araneus ventricosus]
MHNKNLGSTWKNFAYELRSFFNEWVNGVKADSFEKLSDLIITDQIKCKVSQEIKDHFIDEWSKLNSPDDLVEKLDDYDTLRSTFRSKQPRKEWHYDKQNSFKDDSAFTTNEKKRLYGERVHNGYREDELFRNVLIDEKGNPVCLERLETAQSESESLRIKDASQHKMMGNLADDLKIVKHELRLLQGDIRNFKEERQSLLLQIQKKNKNVDNLKSINNSLVKTNSYYDKNKSDGIVLDKVKEMSPSKIDVEIRCLSLENGGSEQFMEYFLKALSESLKTKRNFELIHSYWPCFCRFIMKQWLSQKNWLEFYKKSNGTDHGIL